MYVLEIPVSKFCYQFEELYSFKDIVLFIFLGDQDRWLVSQVAPWFLISGVGHANCDD